MSTLRLRGLDGLRGIAILLVLNFHLWAALSGQTVLPPGSPWTFLYAGHTGVALFFVLSGFLVSLPFIKALEHNRRPSLRLYALHRALRILPPYYFIGLIGILLTGHFNQLIPMLTFTANAMDVGFFSMVWWSLATEVQFYLLLPIVFLVANHRFRTPLLGLLGVLAITVYLMVILKKLGPDHATSFEIKYLLILSVFGQMPAFITGMVLAFLYQRHAPMNIRMLPGYAGMLGLIALLGLALLAPAQSDPLIFRWQNPWHVALEAILWGAVIWLLLNREQPPVSVLDNRVTRYFGKISFSLYLVHMPVVALVMLYLRTGELWADYVITFTLSVALAQLSFWFVEQPFLTLKTKLSQSYPQPGQQP